jgi:hypothetical protein
MERKVKNNDIPEIALENGKIRLFAGSYKDTVGYKASICP